MENVIIKKGMPGDDEHLKNLIKYIEDDRKLMIGGNGVDYTNPSIAVEQMMCVKEHFGKTHNDPLVQVIVTFDDSVKDADTACEYVQKAAAFYEDDYQTIYCVHEKDHDCQNYHGHILINPVNIHDGKMLNTSHDQMNAFRSHVSDITGNENRLIYKLRAKKSE